MSEVVLKTMHGHRGIQVWRRHEEGVIKLEQSLYEVGWREEVWRGRSGTAARMPVLGI